MTAYASYSIHPIGFVCSTLKRREEAPRQGLGGVPDAWIEISPCFVEALQGIVVGQENASLAGNGGDRLKKRH